MNILPYSKPRGMSENYRLEFQYLCLLNQILKSNFYLVNKYNPDSNQSCMSATYCKLIGRGNSLFIWRDHCSILAGKPAPSEYSTYTNSISLVASTGKNEFLLYNCVSVKEICLTQVETSWELLFSEHLSQAPQKKESIGDHKQFHLLKFLSSCKRNSQLAAFKILLCWSDGMEYQIWIREEVKKEYIKK